MNKLLLTITAGLIFVSQQLVGAQQPVPPVRRHSCPSPILYYRNDLHPLWPPHPITSMTAHRDFYHPWQIEYIQARAAQEEAVAASTALAHMQLEQKDADK